MLRVNGAPQTSKDGITFWLTRAGHKNRVRGGHETIYRLSWKKGPKRGGLRYTGRRWAMERPIFGRLVRARSVGRRGALRLELREGSLKRRLHNDERALEIASRFAKKRGASISSAGATYENGVYHCTFDRIEVKLGAFSGRIFASYRLR